MNIVNNNNNYYYNHKFKKNFNILIFFNDLDFGFVPKTQGAESYRFCMGQNKQPFKNA
jgi:hypothetical protein